MAAMIWTHARIVIQRANHLILRSYPERLYTGRRIAQNKNNLMLGRPMGPNNWQLSRSIL
jgi:hypothetical protein